MGGITESVKELISPEKPIEFSPTKVMTRVIDIGSPLFAEGYKFENRKRIQKGLPPAIIKIVSKTFRLRTAKLFLP
jgi:hypothetical protein